MMFDRELFDDARKEFLSHLRYAKVAAIPGF